MKLFLHSPNSESQVREIYDKAFSTAIELYVVTAYLTEWDEKLALSENCQHFRIIIGKDFGITKKSACYKVMAWLSSARKSQFLVADQISGFHPKALFWKDMKGKYYSLIGSSNLTKAAFESNYEANLYAEITSNDFNQAVKWVREIEDRSVVVSEDWLNEYVEGTSAPSRSSSKGRSAASEIPVKGLKLPKPKGMLGRIKDRRGNLAAHNKVKERLYRLFLDCSKGKISSSEFYESLPDFWSYKVGNRLQGAGWARSGSSSNFKEISDSFIRIMQANDIVRDDIVVSELDRLHDLQHPARKAFFSELLCLTFPQQYPVLNEPVKSYLRDIKFKPPRGASEGAKYIDLAKKLRISLLQNPTHPAKNLAELDSVVWLKYAK